MNKFFISASIVISTGFLTACPSSQSQDTYTGPPKLNASTGPSGPSGAGASGPFSWTTLPTTSEPDYFRLAAPRPSFLVGATGTASSSTTLYLSTNLGQSWAPLSASWVDAPGSYNLFGWDGYLWVLSAGPQTPATFARSSDGTNFTAIDYSACVDANSPEFLFPIQGGLILESIPADSRGLSLCLSTDDGQSWQPLPQPPTSVGIGFGEPPLPCSTTTDIYLPSVGPDNNVFGHFDGVSWTPFGQQPSSSETFYSCVASSLNDIYCECELETAQCQTVYHSTDGAAATWVEESVSGATLSDGARGLGMPVIFGFSPTDIYTLATNAGVASVLQRQASGVWTSVFSLGIPNTDFSSVSTPSANDVFLLSIGRGPQVIVHGSR